MPEYIEREAVCSKCKNKSHCKVSFDEKQKCPVYKAPTADVVEVVYCRECSHCDPENKHCDHPMGTTLPVPRKDNDFCSYGERKK